MSTILVVGCGNWGVNYVRTFSEDTRIERVVACDMREDRLRDIQKRFPSIEICADLDLALQREGIDAVVVCTNAATHYEVTKRCLIAGKHVLVEKPMALSTAKAETLVQLAKQHQRVLMVGHIFLYNTAVQKIKSYIDEEMFGDLYYLYSRRTNLGPVRQDVNALWDLAPHDVSIFDYLLGQRPEWVSAIGSCALHNAREDVAFVVLGYPNNVLGHIHVSWAEPNKVRELVVVGSQKRIVFNDLDQIERVRIFEKGISSCEDGHEPTSYGEYHFQVRDGDIVSPKIEIREPLKEECGHFLQTITSGTQPLSDGQNGLEVTRIMEAASLSMAHRGAPITLAWDETPEQRPTIADKLKDYVYQKNAGTTL